MLSPREIRFSEVDAERRVKRAFGWKDRFRSRLGLGSDIRHLEYLSGRDMTLDQSFSLVYFRKFV